MGKTPWERCRRALGPNHPHTVRSATTLTFTLAELGEHEQARALGQGTLGALPTACWAPTTLVTLHSAGNLTLTLAELGEYLSRPAPSAKAPWERCRQAFGPDHLITLRLAAVLTYALAGLGERRARPQPWPRHPGALPTGAGPQPPGHPEHGSRHDLYAWPSWVQHQQARALGQDALERCQRVLGPNHLATLGSATGLALALAGLGQHEQARALGQDALERCQRVLGPNHLATQRLRQALGSLTSARPQRSN